MKYSTQRRRQQRPDLAPSNAGTGMEATLMPNLMLQCNIVSDALIEVQTFSKRSQI